MRTNDPNDHRHPTTTKSEETNDRITIFAA